MSSRIETNKRGIDYYSKVTPYKFYPGSEDKRILREGRPLRESPSKIEPLTMSFLARHGPQVLPPPGNLYPLETSRPRSQPEFLPSIRELLPDLESEYRVESASSYSPTTSNNYSPTSNKRRRLSEEDEDEWRREQLNAWHRRSPSGSYRQRNLTISPAPSVRRESLISPTETRTGSVGSPYSSTGHLPYQSPISEPARDFRPTLPNLYDLPNRAQQPTRARSYNEYSLEASRPAQAHSQYNYHSHDRRDQYNSASFPYGYQQPRGQSFTAPPHHLSQGQTPFTNGHHSGAMGQASYSMEMSDSSVSGDNRQRRRRGNLPKHTTDVLNAWFLSHLQHAYPTEDEKQELMRQTGLQMNQISNWFINARRRKLPALQNSARAQAHATARMQSRDGYRDVVEYEDEERNSSQGESDIESNSYATYPDELHPRNREIGNYGV